MPETGEHVGSPLRNWYSQQSLDSTESLNMFLATPRRRLRPASGFSLAGQAGSLLIAYTRGDASEGGAAISAITAIFAIVK